MPAGPFSTTRSVARAAGKVLLWRSPTTGMRKRASAILAVLMMMAAVAPATATAPAAVDAGASVVDQRADPDEDVVGWEGGYWHDDEVDIDQSDGLSDEELDAYVARAMARVEYLRESEFDSEVPVEVLPREEFKRQRNESATGNTSFDAWNDQVWEALFVIGEEREANEALQSATGETTAGFYATSDDRIRIITDSPDSPTIDNATLVHELVHALQDQDGDLGERISTTETQDAGLATDGVVEGEANYIEQRYTSRCGVEWECVETPSSGGGPGQPPNLGILLTLLQPYSDGPVYIDWLIERGGWDAVEAAFESPPQSTEQIIHLTDEEPVPIEYTDRARNGWETFPNQGEGGSDTVGEASMYVMFWYQARTAGARTVSPQSVVQTANQYDIYNYDAEPSAGWGNDRVFPYERGSGEEAQYGYVWVTEWDTEEDADEFVEAYGEILVAQGVAEFDGEGQYVVPSGEFADAFRIDRQGTRVTIVNAPTAEDLSDVRPAPESGSGGTAASDDAGSTGLEAPGFGPLTAVLALVAAVALVAVARRLD